MHLPTFITLVAAIGSVAYANPLLPRGAGKLCNSADKKENGVCRTPSTGCAGGAFKTLNGWGCGSGAKCCVFPKPTASKKGGNSGGHINRHGINLIKSAEGLELSIYPDQRGTPTIGYGHNCAVHSCPESTITEAQAEKFLKEDLANPANRYETMVCDLPGAHQLNENQFSALVDFAFNLGAWGAEKHLKTVFKGDIKASIKGVQKNILKWNPIDNRRQRELDLFNVPSTTMSGCAKPKALL